MSVVATVDPYTSAKDIPHAEVGAGLFYLLYLYICALLVKIVCLKLFFSLNLASDWP